MQVNPAMQLARTIPDCRAAVAAARRTGRRIAMAPTMGALHAGHLSLFRAAAADGAFVVASIFVNPTQFAPHEDFARYPRDEAGDLAACAGAGVELVFLPTAAEMYPPDAATTVRVAGLSDGLCGPLRPGHFEGVATVVAKLLNIVQPDAAYFGRKDAQQLAIIRRMARDLDMPVEIVGCPTVREADGLALSSRNAYLSPEQRRQAACLYRALSAAAERAAAGERDATALVAQMRQVIGAAGRSDVEYVSIVDPETLKPVERVERPALAALAVRIGATRLIDNMLLSPGAAQPRSV